jgi:fumarylacetoacetase
MPKLDTTHDPALRSWIESANEPTCDFSIQNLPWGVFRRRGTDETPRIGVAIGQSVLDVAGCLETDLLAELDEPTTEALKASTLNTFMALGRDSWTSARQAISGLLATDTETLRDNKALRPRLLVPLEDAEPFLPATVGDYTDYYASIHHAANVGSMFRPDNPLLPNYKHLPVAYHGRASSLVVSGAEITRPRGQTKADDAAKPSHGPTRLLDYELEMGFFVGPGNDLGSPIAIKKARNHIFGMVIVNDWSARDIQKWEYQPLGPFCAKNFATTVSPWVVTLDALEPYRIEGPPRAADDPSLLGYLKPAEDMALELTVEVQLASAKMRDKEMAPLCVSQGSFSEMYWTIAQMLVHHSVSGCNLRPGDLLASGTVSGPTEGARGCLLELTWRGQNPVSLPDGTKRRFLEDGDEVIIRAWAQREGAARVGFGECRGIVAPAG